MFEETIIRTGYWTKMIRAHVDLQTPKEQYLNLYLSSLNRFLYKQCRLLFIRDYQGGSQQTALLMLFPIGCFSSQKIN